MARAQLIITAVVVEGRSKTEVARDYGSPATGCSSWSAAIGVRGRRLSAAVPAAAVPAAAVPAAASQPVCPPGPPPGILCRSPAAAPDHGPPAAPAAGVKAGRRPPAGPRP